MDNFVNLKWRWLTGRSDEQNDRLYAADFSDDEMDVFLNHLHEIDHVHRLDAYNPQLSHNSSSDRHSDPRTGAHVTRHLIDATFAVKPQLHSAFGRLSSLPAWQHAAGLRVLMMKPSNASTVLLAGTTKHPRAAQAGNVLKTFAVSAAKRAAEGKEFAAVASAYFNSHTVKRLHSMQPFLSDRIAAEWSRALSDAVVNDRMAQNAYAIQTAIPLDMTSAETVRMEVGEAIGVSDLPMYTKCERRRQFPRAGEFAAPFWTQPQDIPNQHLMRTHDASVFISLNVIRQLIDYPANSTESWLVPFEIAEDVDGLKRCVFDELLPVPVLQAKQRNHLALRRQLLGDMLQSEPKETVAQDADASLNVSLGMKYHPVEYKEYVETFCRTIHAAHDVRPAIPYRIVDLNGTYRMLVRTIVDGREMIPVDKQPILVHVSVKPEYQSEFGAEQMSQSELVDEWCRLVFNPDSVVDRYRLDAETGTIFSVIRLTRVDIEEELLRLHSVKPDALMARVYEIIRMIMNFPCQQYLLRHSYKPDRTARVYGRVKTSTPATVNIEKILAEEAAGIPSDTFTWTPIDETCITGIHLQANVMPCMFPHTNPTTAAPQPRAKRQSQLNDRDILVARRQSEVANREAAKLQIQQRQKTAKMAVKRQKRTQRQKKLQAAAELAQKDDDANPYLTRNEAAIDPGVLFDAHGNIKLHELMKP